MPLSGTWMKRGITMQEIKKVITTSSECHTMTAAMILGDQGPGGGMP
jgi:hypothetical protein